MVKLSRQQRYQRLTIVDLDILDRDRLNSTDTTSEMEGEQLAWGPTKGRPEHHPNINPASAPPYTALTNEIPTSSHGHPDNAHHGSYHEQQQQQHHCIGFGTDSSLDPSSPNSSRLVPMLPKKSVVEAYILALSPFGVIGAHHFYLQRYGWGLLYLFTCGLCGLGYIIDWFRLPYLVKMTNAKRSADHSETAVSEKNVSDAYTLWFPFGLLGFHHYYLGNFAWGVLYTCTAGIFSIGWLVDCVRIPSLVKAANERRLSGLPAEKSYCDAYFLSLPPFGLLGGHQYYLGRSVWGLLYTCTLGLVGLGWLLDLVRMPCLVRRANKELSGVRRRDTKTVDDAYLLWLLFGLLGFHHFYLNRPVWGALYFFTLGIVGMGWLVDVARLPSLVREANKKNEERGPLIHPSGPSPSHPDQTYTAVVAVDVQNYGLLSPGAYPSSGSAGLGGNSCHFPPLQSNSPPPAYSPAFYENPPPYVPPNTPQTPEVHGCSWETTTTSK